MTRTRGEGGKGKWSRQGRGRACCRTPGHRGGTPAFCSAFHTCRRSAYSDVRVAWKLPALQGSFPVPTQKRRAGGLQTFWTNMEEEWAVTISKHLCTFQKVSTCWLFPSRIRKAQKLCRFESQVYHFHAGWPQATHFISLDLNFLI